MHETYRGFVNAWECDENAHLNVQGYVWRFDLAARHFLAGNGTEWPSGGTRVRHIRYLRECGTGDLIAGKSVRLDDGTPRLVHVLCDAETGAPLATAVDTFERLGDLPAGPLPDMAGARSIAPEPDDELRPAADLADKGYRRTFTGMVGADQVAADGGMSDRHFIAATSDAVAHAWAAAGFTKDWLDRRGCGRVAVEMKLSVAARPAEGTLFEILSGIAAVSRSTITFRHVIAVSAGNACLATVNVTALVMNLADRRAAPLPEEMRRSAELLMARGGPGAA